MIIVEKEYHLRRLPHLPCASSHSEPTGREGSEDPLVDMVKFEVDVLDSSDTDILCIY